MDKQQGFQRFQEDVVHIFTEREIEQIWNEIQASSFLSYGENWDEEKYLDMVIRLNNQEPYQYITGRSYFYDFELNVSSATLIPRSETEELVEMIVKDVSGSSPKYDQGRLQLLDIGTGSGCIAIALARKLNNVQVQAIDISKEAVKIARKNADEIGVDVDFQVQDVLDLKRFSDTYHVIVSNPPYIPQKEKYLMHENVLDYEPHVALFVEDDDPLIFYRKIAELAFGALHVNGILYFECNEFNAKDVLQLVESLHYSEVSLHRDFQGKDRMIRAIK